MLKFFTANRRVPTLCLAALTGFSSLLIHAQNGDHAGESQTPPPLNIVIPPAPVLSPSEALNSFKLQPGFEIELVAAEPLVETPVAMTFDADGRMWVLEMRGYMPDPDGKGEDQPKGRVSVLEDTNGDGRMDKSTIFAEGLVMPRALALVQGGLLLAEPPNLWFFKDTNGDFKSDQKTLVATNYGSQVNPEHTSNGLMQGMDGWIYSANHTTKIRYARGEWVQEPTIFRGQWGISQDDEGRLYYNSNSDQLRGDLLPESLLARNRFLANPTGLNFPVAKDQSVFPSRPNTGVNRGYQKGQLRPDGTLATFTGACGPVVYRGDNFPPVYKGAVFLCEPTANIIRCNFISELDGLRTATNAFPNAEFLASTDERFRPVNLYNGPDGGLYIVDIHRGLIQHRIYLTSYLRQQTLSRGLEGPVNLGRVYRVVRAGTKHRKPLNLSKLSPSRLVSLLSSPNGWTRDKAQQLLVEGAAPKTAALLQKWIEKPAGLGALHALWALSGLDQAGPASIAKGLSSSNTPVIAASLRLAEPMLKRGELPERSISRIRTLANHPSAEIRILALMVLVSSPEDHVLVAGRLANGSPLLRDAILSGAQGSELNLIQALNRTANGDPSTNSHSTISKLAELIYREGSPIRISSLLDYAAQQTNRPLQTALLKGMSEALPKPGKDGKLSQPMPQIELGSEPTALKALRESAQEPANGLLVRVESTLHWPGKVVVEEARSKPLSAEEKERFARGKELYLTTCGACHQPHGNGQEGLAPPLAGSDWTTGSEQRIARIVLNGLRGPINIKGRVYEMEMPPLGVLDDEQIASLLTYVRREWGHTASPISPEFVKKVRDETSQREEAWKEVELLKIP